MKERVVTMNLNHGRKQTVNGLFRKFRGRESEKGLALILCIGFLAILSMLGAFVLDMTNRDLKMTSVDRSCKATFFTADRAVEYALSPPAYTALDYQVAGSTLDLTTTPHIDSIADGLTNLTSGVLTYEGSGGPPQNSNKYDKTGSSGKIYRYFHVAVHTESSNALYKDSCNSWIDAQLVQAFPAVTSVPVTYASGKEDSPGTTGGN